MLHGDASITANFRNKDPINYFFDELDDILDGTIWFHLSLTLFVGKNI